MQLNFENEVVDEEAAYAQDQLLIFISKCKYAFHPAELCQRHSTPKLDSLPSHSALTQF
jgi:hypothetical protein